MDERENLRRLVMAMVEAAGTDLTGLARKAGLSPSTLTRFMNSNAKNLLSTRTLNKLSKASGIDGSAGQDGLVPQPVGIKAVEAVAKALGVELPGASDRRPRTLEWLRLIGRLPPAVENHAFDFIKGLGNSSGAPEKKRGPRERSRVRRKG